MNPLLLAFYGDDFTGSADAMEALTINGVKTALFLGHPTEERLRARLSDLQAVGISGTSRTMTPSQMDAELPAQLALLNSLEPRLIHYKVCATFNSSPRIGSIGHAADIAFDVIRPSCGVIVQGIPLLGRYIVFGNHFTVYGDQRYRLDRHPVMSSIRRPRWMKGTFACISADVEEVRGTHRSASPGRIAAISFRSL